MARKGIIPKRKATRDALIMALAILGSVTE